MKSPFVWLRSLVLAAAITLAACSDSPSDNLELRVGDQLRGLKSRLDVAGEGEPSGYTLRWSNFVGGPPIIAAQTGGSLDVGWMAETPLIFAQAAGSPVKVVAVSLAAKPDASPYALVVKADSPIRSVADLKGKSVAYMQGTVLHYMVARVLDDAGLSLKDINSVQVTGFGSSLLDRGAADALTLTEPYLTQMLDAGTVRVLATGAPPATPGFFYLVASEAALADPKRSEAIGDLVARTARATRWERENVPEAARALAQVYQVEQAVAERIIERTPTRFAPLDADIVAAHQEEADLFHKIGLIRAPLDANAVFDARYDAVIAQVEDTP